MNKGPYIYKNSVTGFTCEDVGLTEGVILRMDYPIDDESLALILPPKEVRDLTEWLARSFSATINQMPIGLDAMFKNILAQPGHNINLKSGDKRRFKQALAVIQGEGIY